MSLLYKMEIQFSKANLFELVDLKNLLRLDGKKLPDVPLLVPTFLIVRRRPHLKPKLQ